MLPPFEDEWYCSKMVVTPPEGQAILFPCYRWISSGELVELRGGKGLPQIQKTVKFDSHYCFHININVYDYFQNSAAVKVFEEVHPSLEQHRREQLSLKKTLYR